MGRDEGSAERNAKSKVYLDGCQTFGFVATLALEKLVELKQNKLPG